MPAGPSPRRASRRPRGGIRSDAGWLVATQLVALLATFIATPIELERMGTERYGVVVVLSAAVGYTALMDVGAAWGVMRFVPWHRQRGDLEAAQRVVAAALLLSLGVGTVLGLVVYVLAAPLGALLNLSGTGAAEATTAVRVSAAFVPVLLVGSLLSGLGRAVGMFRLVGVVAAAQVVALNVVWVAAAGDPDDVVTVLVAQLVIGLLVIACYLLAIGLHAGWVLRPRLPRGPALREITGFGSKTSAGQAGLGLVTAADKPVLGAVMPVSVIPGYSIPFALASRITLVSSSVCSAVFPPVVAALAAGDEAEFARLRQRAFSVVGLVSGLLVVNCVAGGRPFLEWWVGDPVAADGWPALAALGVGFGILACGSIGNVLLDAAGRPGVAAAIMIGGGAIGLGLATALGAAGQSAAAASAGSAVGLAIIGLGGIERARRLVVPQSRAATLRTLFAAWPLLAAAGAALRLGGEALALPSLVTVGLVATGTGAIAVRRYQRSR